MRQKWTGIESTKNYVGFGSCAAQRVLMFILVNIIFTFVLGLLDKMLGWQRWWRRHPDDNLRYSGVFTVVGGSVPPPARHRPLGVVGTAILNPVYRLAYYHRL